MFDQMPRHNVVSWTVMIAAYAKQGCSNEALVLFHQMKLAGIRANQFSFVSVVPACTRLGILKEGKRMHDEMIRRRFESDVSWGVLLWICMSNARVWRKHTKSLINCLSEMWSHELPWLQDMHRMGRLRTHRSCFTKCLKEMYVQRGRVDDAMKLYWKMLKRDVVSWNSMIAGYEQNENADEALTLFEQMPEKYLV